MTTLASKRHKETEYTPAAGNNLDMSIVLVCWNNKKYLEDCLNSLFKDSLQAAYDVVVVDNGSTDGSQAMLTEKFPNVRIIQNESNVGLARACNQGIEATDGRYVLLLNNDTLVNGEAIDALVTFLDTHPRAGAVGGRVLNEDGTVQSCYNDFSTLREEFLIATRLGTKLRNSYPAYIDVDEVSVAGFITSACLLLRRDALHEIGLLDEEYFIYGDEADIQFRLQQAGWGVYYIPETTIVHFGGRSMNRWSRRKMVYRGKMLFYQKNYGTFRTLLLRGMLGVLSLAKMGVWGVVALVPSHRERARKELTSNIEVVKLCYQLN